MHIAAALPLTRRATVVTHSPGVAASFEFHSGIDVVQVGGPIFRHSMVAVGAEAGLAFAKVKPISVFWVSRASHPAHGLTDRGPREAEIKKIMVEPPPRRWSSPQWTKLARSAPGGVRATRGTYQLFVARGDRPDWLPPSGASPAG